MMVLSAVVIVWFTIGGLRDLRSMTRALSSTERDTSDDGWVGDDASRS